MHIKLIAGKVNGMNISNLMFYSTFAFEHLRLVDVQFARLHRLLNKS